MRWAFLSSRGRFKAHRAVWVLAAALALTASVPADESSRPFHDRSHASRVFEQDRLYRIFLPLAYTDSKKRYPVIYYFHGHSDRYTLERYDQGKDTVPKIAAFVRSNEVIVVSVDGYVANHSNSMVRLVRASGDYISQYHEETRRAYAQAQGVEFEFRQDEYHRHWATSIAETFDFHLRAFGRSELDNTPEFFSHDDAYKSFDVWGYHVEVDRSSAGLTSLHGVRQGGMRITTRRWAPDGPPATG